MKKKNTVCIVNLCTCVDVPEDRGRSFFDCLTLSLLLILIGNHTIVWTNEMACNIKYTSEEIYLFIDDGGLVRFSSQECNQ